MDEGTLALLDSLEVRSSRSDLLTRNIDILLHDKDNYNPWMEQMMEMLESENMTGFVDGSLRDPDPKGESQEERVRIYSEKWKKLDKQVMKWIMASLNGTLNYMVEEMKTAKEMWDTLYMFFTTALSASLEDTHFDGKGVMMTFDIKLNDKEKYQPWRDQMMEFLDSQGMKGFIDGTFRDPGPEGESKVEHVTMYSQKWEKLDKLVMEWITGSLDDIYNFMVHEMKTAKEMWDKLETFFTGDIGALLASLEDSHSHREVVMKIIDIRLLDKEDYQSWSDDMMEYLNSKKMKGVIDGTSTDPDPKGERGEEHVRIFSAIWKRMDKQVMNWIMVSLDDILYYMVEEMKTAKELWDMLVTFFSKEDIGRLDSNSSLKLNDETTYVQWKEKTESFLVNENRGAFIDGTFRDPSKISRSIRQKDKGKVKEYSERWTLLDQHVMTLIKSSLSDILRDIVNDLRSSKEVWHALQILCTTGYPPHIPENAASFLSIKLSDKENYLQWAQQIKYLLEFHGLQNLIDPLSRLPPATFVNHANWKNYDQLLKGWISSSLEQNVIDETLTRIPTATGLWGEIKNRYGPLDVEYTDLQGGYNHVNSTELYKAIMSGDLEATKRELNRHGYDVELTQDGPTPLHVIIVTRKKNHQYFEKVLDHVVTLIQTEARESTSTSTNSITLVNLVNRDGRNTLHRAALVGNLNAAKRLVDTDPYLLFKEDNDKCLPIDVAISTPHKDTFRYLLIASKKNLNIFRNKGFTKTFGLINPFEGKHGVRLLIAAIEAGYMEVAYQLIKMNTDIAAENDGNSFRTPLHKAVENYDKYYDLPIRWRIFDQDAGMEFKATIIMVDETVPSNQEGTQNGGRWYNKAWIQNLGKGFRMIFGNWFVKMIWNRIVKKILCNWVVMMIWNRIVKKIFCNWVVKMIWNRIVKKIFCNWVVKMIWNWIVDTLKDLQYRFKKFLWNLIVYPFIVSRYDIRWIRARVYGSFLYLKRRELGMSATTVANLNSLPEEEVTHNKSLLVLRSICNRLRLQSTTHEKRNHYHSASCVAACKDQHEALKEMAEHFPEVILMEGDGYNLMQSAVKHRSEKVFNFLAYETKVDTYFFKVKPKFGSSLLHYAGGLTPPEKLDKDSGAALQMRKEVKWFKKVEKFALPGCDNEKNNMDETPIMVFRKEHADLKKRGEEWTKTVANSYIIVAALIITITFAALITVPGGSQQDSGDSPVGTPAGSPVASPVVNQNSVGLPIFIENNLFMVFVFSNVTSFCGATSALVMFLSILTSRYTEEDFINKLPWKLAIGLLALIVSLVGMLVAFSATLLLMLGDKDTFILVGIAFGIGLPIVTFIGFQVRMLWKIFR